MILVGKPLIKQHQKHCDEIVSVIAHELGHWAESHLLKSALTDTIYMVIFGLFLLQVENSAGFLTSFGFHQESYFVSLGLFVWLFMISLDPILRVGMHLQQRYNEYRADSFATQQGYGISLQFALIRSHAENLDNLFTSSIDKWVNLSHPDLHERLEAIEMILNEQPKLRQNAEENQQMLSKISFEMTDSDADEEEEI